MTPARLEEVEREMDGVDPMYVIACELLAEVKRLREVLRDIRERGDACRCAERCGCGAESGDDADDALAGWDTRP